MDGEVDGKDNLSAIHNITVNTEGILDFLREFKEKVFAGKDIFTVGEANGVSADELGDWVGERGVFIQNGEHSTSMLYEQCRVPKHQGDLR